MNFAIAAMAATMPQMAGGGQMRGRPAQQQLTTAVYSHIMNQPMPQGWQSQLPPQTRMSHAMNMYNPFLSILAPKSCADIWVVFPTPSLHIRRWTPNL